MQCGAAFSEWVAVGLLEQLPDALPVKVSAGVGFSSGGNVAVSCPLTYRIILCDGRQQRVQCVVLCGGKCLRVAALQLNADGKIVAVFPSLPV